MAALIPHTSSQDSTSGTSLQDSTSGPSLPPGSDLDLLIVGKSGHGKSATANSILGEELFETNSLEVLQKEIDGRKLLVVDTPGPSDTDILDPELCRKKMQHDISLEVCLSPEGFHAIVIVFRYGQRMTKGEIETLEELKNLLGENFMRDYGVLVITCGDQFDRKLKEKTSFKTWCEVQTGYLQDVLQKCQNRCLLFNNLDESAWKQQRFELVQMIDGMKSGKRYKRDIVETVRANCRTAEGSLDGYFDWFLLPIINTITWAFGWERDTRKPVHEIKCMLDELKCAVRRLDGHVKQRLDDSMRMAECRLLLDPV